MDLNNLEQINLKIKEFLDLKLDYNIPTFLSYDYEKLILIYQDNQICTMNINLFKENNNNIINNFPLNKYKN